MRVLLTTDTVGGVWTFTKELAMGLLQRGHAVALVSFGAVASKSQASWCTETAQLADRAFQYEGTAVPLEWMQENHAAYTGGESLLLQVADEFGAEVLHTSQFCFGRLPVAIPRIVTAHSDVLSWARACKPAGLEPSPWLDRYHALVQEGLSAADALVAPTHWMLAALRESFDVSAPEHVIHNGRDIHPPVAPPRKLQAVSVGRLWDEAKNLQLLTRIDSPMPLIVAGPTRCNEAEASHNTGLTTLGPLPESDLLRLFSESSVYVAPSLYEPFGLAPLEAALCGCAVVAMDLPSFREVWADAAIYFSNEPELSSVLQMLHDSPSILAEAQAKARQRARQFNRGKMTEAYLALYRRLLGSQASPSSQQVSYAQ